MKTGIDAARVQADKLKAETKKEEEEEVKETEAVKNELSLVAGNKTLADLYNTNSQVGAENLSGEVPLLKIFAAGKTRSLLADNSKPNDGWFYYKPDMSQFKELTVRILSVSKGFRAPGMARDNEEPRMVFNQLVSGIILNEKLGKPFVMYFTGKKLSRLWEFGKEIAKYTHGKPVAIPMFALKIKLTTSEEANDFGTSWVINFEVEKDENGFPVVITDLGEFTFVRDMVDSAKKLEESILSSRMNQTEVETAQEIKEESRVTTPPAIKPGEVNPDIPF